jgi:hypothetical protein
VLCTLICPIADEMADLVTDYLVHGMIAANHEMTRADAAWLLELGSAESFKTVSNGYCQC